MWKYSNEQELAQEMQEKLSKYSKIAGSIFLILGTIGIIYPAVMTMATVAFVSWLLLLGGLIAGYFTYLSDKSDVTGWLKSIVLIGVALFMMFYPMSGVGTVGLLLSIYFFIDSFTSFSMALSMRPAHGWFIWFLNAIFSLPLAILFVVGWPLTSVYLIGLFVGFSLFFDGVSLLTVGTIYKKRANK